MKICYNQGLAEWISEHEHTIIVPKNVREYTCLTRNKFYGTPWILIPNWTEQQWTNQTTNEKYNTKKLKIACPMPQCCWAAPIYWKRRRRIFWCVFVYRREATHAFSLLHVAWIYLSLLLIVCTFGSFISQQAKESGTGIPRFGQPRRVINIHRRGWSWIYFSMRHSHPPVDLSVV